MRAKQVKIAVAALCAAFCAASFGKDFSISDFGAVADGRLCTKAFAAAVDACAAAGGGRVTVPAGTWFTGSIRLKSNVELHLDDKAVVRFSDELADLLPAVMSTYEGVEVFGYCPLIYAYCCTNIAVTGGGLLTTDQTRWRQRQLFAEKDKGARALAAGYNAGVRAQKTPPEKRDVTVYGEAFVVRPHFIQLNRCSGARLEGFRLRYSPFWFVEIFKSSDVVCRGVSVFGMFGNSDAFDVDSSQRVLIESCTIDTGDDAFAVKSGRDEDGRRLATPSQDVEIRNCHVIRSGGFVVIGSEITGGAKNVLVHDCTAGVVRDVFVLRSDASRGGHVENITMRNCRVDRCQRWFFNTRSGWPVDPVRVVSMDRVRWTTYDKILVENVVVGDCGQRMNIVGSPEAPYRGIVVRDCTIDSVRDATNRVENVAADVSLDGLKVLGRALPPRPRVNADDFLMAPDFDYAEVAARVPRSAYLVHRPVKDKAEEDIRWKRFSNLRRCGWETVVEKRPAPLLVLHIDLKAGAFTRAAIERQLEVASKAGYTAVLWEVEDKVRWETCPAAAHPEAFSKDEFRAILSTARRLGLRPIPLLQTCGHAAYVLSRKDYEPLRERPLEEIGTYEDADSYCASKSQTRDFLKRLIAEHLDLFGPDVREFHLGGDEAYTFGKCADCRSHDRGALYVDHLDALAEVLRARGVRPGIWCDMILSSLGDAALARLPKDFIVWHWDYAYGTTPRVMKWTRRLGEVTARGFDVVFAGASQCAGDDPFLVRQAFHRRNLAAVADCVRTNAYYGMCVTSWSVREGAKRVQYPLWEFAAKRLLKPAADEQSDWSRLVAKWFGPVPVGALDAVSEWSSDFRAMECRGRRRHFDPGRPVAPLQTFDPVKVRSDLAATRAKLRAVQPELAAAKGPLGDTLREAAALKLAALDVFEARLDGKPDSSEELYAAAARYYSREETPASARTAAHMLEPRQAEEAK